MCLCMTFNSSSKALKSLSFYCYICQTKTGGLRQRFNLNMTAHMRTLARRAISKELVCLFLLGDIYQQLALFLENAFWKVLV